MENKKHIITIAGRPGSGKSSTGKNVAKNLEYKHFSTGDFFRTLAKEKGLSVTELNHLAEQDSTIDQEIDAQSRNLRDEEGIVLDSRMAFHFIPDSFKVYLKIDPDISIQRIFKDAQVNEDRKSSEVSYTDIKHVEEEMVARYNSENKRYKTLYDADPSNLENYDLVIDTGLPANNLDTVVKGITSEYHKWLASD